MKTPSSKKRTRRPTSIAKRLRAKRGKNIFQELGQLLSRTWKRFQQQRMRGASRSLRLEESVSLGQKRFVAVVKVDGQRFLIGVSSEITMLTPLNRETKFAKALQKPASGPATTGIEACA